MESIMRNRELTETRMMQVRFYDASSHAFGFVAYTVFSIRF